MLAYTVEKFQNSLFFFPTANVYILCKKIVTADVILYQERIPMVNLAAALEKEGISAFHFDFAGNG